MTTPPVHDAELTARLQLLHLPSMGPARARWLTASGSAVTGLDLLRSAPTELGRAPAGVTASLRDRWLQALADLDGDELLRRHRCAPWALLHEGDLAWPFAGDPEPPIVAFVAGDPSALAPAGRRVGIVGTRQCTSVGLDVAHAMGRELTRAGVQVVSGLALGIDAAAHRGAIEALEEMDALPTSPDCLTLSSPASSRTSSHPAPIAVVATGLDRVYPRQNRQLWQSIIDCGVVVSESPLGTPPARWRFPARNRLIASLVDVVVVVESHDRGGALHTVDEATERGRTVAVVPGSVRSAASVGTNALLTDGCPPVRHAADVLDLIGADAAPRLEFADPSTTPASPLTSLILGELATGDTTLDSLWSAGLQRNLRPTLAELVAEVGSLEREGTVHTDGTIVGLTRSQRHHSAPPPPTPQV